jgi:hypothetical protein
MSLSQSELHWLHMQQEPDYRIQGQGGMPITHGGVDDSPRLDEEWQRRKDLQWEIEENERQDAYLRSKGAG